MTATTTEEKKNDTAPASSSALARHVTPALELVPVPAFQMTLEPDGFDQAWRVAGIFAAVRYCGITTPEDAMARIMYGRNLGMTAAAACANVNMIEGKPCIEAATMRGVCLQRPDICETFEIVSATPKGCTVRGKRVGQAQVLEATFTIDDAAIAKLLDRGKDEKAQEKNNWNRYPEDMCVARASARLARRLFPDLIRGFATTEEMNDVRRLRRAGIEDADIVEPEGDSPAAVVASAPSRDFGRETEKFKADCLVAKTSADFKKLREDFQSFGDAEPWRGQMRTAYDGAIARAREEKGAPPAATDAPKDPTK
jgi:hypothetical protein